MNVMYFRWARSTSIMERLLRYATAYIEFADMEIFRIYNKNIIACFRVFATQQWKEW